MAGGGLCPAGVGVTLPDAVLRTLLGLKKSFRFNKLQRHVGRIGRLRRIRHLRHLQYLTQNYRFNLSALRKSW